MAFKKSVGILVLATQVVIGADYYIQTRDAGLRWGDLSATDYGTILQDRFARARAAKALAAQHAQTAEGEAQPLWQAVTEMGSSLFAEGAQLAEADTDEAPKPICIRRGNVADC